MNAAWLCVEKYVTDLESLEVLLGLDTQWHLALLEMYCLMDRENLLLQKDLHKSQTNQQYLNATSHSAAFSNVFIFTF